MIYYANSSAGVTVDHLRGFFVGWPNPPSPETHLKVLQGSDEVVLAVDDYTGDLVGFITALTDGVIYAYISLLEVLPQHQGHSIGSELVRRMLAKLEKLYAIDVLRDQEVQPFYARLGMRPAAGMLVR